MKKMLALGLALFVALPVGARAQTAQTAQTAPVAPVAPVAPDYRLTKVVALGGSLKWDYLHLDSASNRLYISHGLDVDVLNATTGAKLGILAGLPGSHGIAVDPATGLVYADSAKNSQAIAFNPKTFKPVATMPVVQDADGMVYDPASKQIFVAGGDGNALTPLNTATRTAEPNIALGGSPEFLVVDGHGGLYVNINDKNEIVKIDTTTNKITARWPTAPCASPTGLAIDHANMRLFSSCHSGVMLVMDANTGRVITTAPIGQGTDAAAYDATHKLAFSSNSNGTLDIMSPTGPDTYKVSILKTAQGARTMAENPATGRVYLVTATVDASRPPVENEGKIKYNFKPGSVKLLIFDPVK